MDAELRKAIQRKLNPERFPNMSGKMAAIVGCILGVAYTEPVLTSLIVTSDECVLAMREGDIGYNEFFGSESDLKRNWKNLLNVAELTPDERAEVENLYILTMRRA